MKRVILPLIVMSVFSSCREDSVNTEIQTDPIPEPKNEVKIAIAIDKSVDLSNLQVGDVLPVNFNIKDQDTAGVTYTLSPEEGNAVLHQKLGKDFKLYKTHSRFSKSKKDTEVAQLSFKPKDSKGQFFIKILEPGNFQHKYVLQKWKGTYNQRVDSVGLAFNAVKLNFWTYGEQIQNGTVFRSSTNRRYYFFTIDDGKEKYDSYLTTSENKKQTYSVLYAGRWYQEGDGSISADQEKRFRGDDERKKRYPDVPAEYVSELKIKQTLSDGTINNISYKNIPVTKK